jgi:3-methylfumaryl-CoA hydratase
MWAASKVEFLQPLKVGEAVTRVSQVQGITAKPGNSGQLVFLDLAHVTSGENGPAVREVQTLVYREAPAPGTPPAPPPLGADIFDPGAWQAHRAVVPSEALLFRYSALTFNSHRIHYDAPYAVAQENYRGLVVHGPLTAGLLLDLAAQQLGDNRLQSFNFKGVSPAIGGEMLHLVLRSKDAAIDLGGYANDGRAVMTAQAEV